MARTRKDEQRLLSRDEFQLAQQTRHPAIKSIGDSDLSSLTRRLREQRDRASDIARRQRREMRGKSAPTGQRTATDDTGTREKRDVLAAALKRANKESERRRRQSGKDELVANSRRALTLKRQGAKQARPTSRTANEGMRPLPNTDIAPSGALDAEGHRPVLERSRKVR